MSVVEYFKFPEAFTGLLLTVAFILLISPYASGADFKIFRVPRIPEESRGPLKVAGPVVFIAVLFLFVPIRLFVPQPADDATVLPPDTAHMQPGNEPVGDSVSVTFTLERLTVFRDGDRLTDGKGDLIWQFSLNGQELSREDVEQNLDDGETVELGSRVTLQLLRGDSLVLRGHVTDRDGFLSGGDDRIDFFWSERLGQSTSGRLRPAEGSDPDVAVSFKVDVSPLEAMR